MDMDIGRNGNESGYVRIPRGVMVVFCYVLPALLVSALIASGVWGSSNRARAEELRRTNEGIYRQAYTELADSVYNMQIALSKLMVSEAPATLSETLDEIRFESGAIAGLMGRIPQSHADSYELNRFLIQIGDYAKSLSGALRRGGRLTEEDRGQLLEVFTASEAVFGELSEKLSSGNIPLSALDGNGFFAQTAQYEEGARYPSLIYDGPYSQSMESREPLGLSGEDIDDKEANRRAISFLEDDGASLEYGGVSGGKLPFHGFSGRLSDGSEAEIAMSVTGGQMLYLRRTENSSLGGEAGGGENENAAQAPDENELDRLKAAGQSWLERMGYPEMEATYAQFYDESVMISFAAVQRVKLTSVEDGIGAFTEGNAEMSELIGELRASEYADEETEYRVILYNDLVKLWLSRESGRVIGADARSFLFTHTERELTGRTMSPESAAKRLSKNLEIEKTALALIPMPDGSERLCHEFAGSFAGDKYIVYLDARTGDEVRILRVVNDENGTSVL